MDRNKILQEAFDVITKHERCTAAISMGVGKTKLGIMHMDYHYNTNAKYLVVAPTLKILDNWKSEMIKWNYEYLLKHTDFSTYISLPKQNLNKYQCIYLDEVHSLVKKSHYFYLSTYSGMILGLTGTPPKNRWSEKYEMINTFCPIVFTYSLNEAVEQKILNDYNIIVHGVNLCTEKNIPVKNKNWFTSEVKQYEYWDKMFLSAPERSKSKMHFALMRMRVLQDFKSKELLAQKIFNESTEKCIVFCNTQEQADRMCPYTYHSKNKLSEVYLQKFINGEINKLAAVQQLNEGANIPGLKEIIVIHSFSSNSPKFIQKTGRCLRLEKDELATIHLLYYKNTIDEKWVKNTLKYFDERKIVWQ